MVANNWVTTASNTPVIQIHRSYIFFVTYEALTEVFLFPLFGLVSQGNSSSS